MTRPFGAGELSTSKSSAVHALKWRSSLRCGSGINQIFTRQMFSLSVWCIFNRSAVFCLFIVSNSQRGFIVCEGFFWGGCRGMKVLFISGCALGFMWKHQTRLNYFISPHTVEFISIFIMPPLFICRILGRLYDGNSWSVPAHGVCAAHSSIRLLFKERLIN